MLYWLDEHLTSSFYFYLAALSTGVLLLRLLTVSRGAGGKPMSTKSIAIWLPLIFCAGFGWMGHSYETSYELPVEICLISATGFGIMMSVLGGVGMLSSAKYRHGKPEEDQQDTPKQIN